MIPRGTGALDGGVDWIRTSGKIRTAAGVSAQEPAPDPNFLRSARIPGAEWPR